MLWRDCPVRSALCYICYARVRLVGVKWNFTAVCSASSSLVPRCQVSWRVDSIFYIKKENVVATKLISLVELPGDQCIDKDVAPFDIASTVVFFIISLEVQCTFTFFPVAFPATIY